MAVTTPAESHIMRTTGREFATAIGQLASHRAHKVVVDGIVIKDRLASVPRRDDGDDSAYHC